ncbi:hypothetical protein DSM3645_02623 [Blastopirellula marina DSM 3645]|uniref:Uncharacterized protein n=1 Tax=Blastopirellula marina DSM 3645 TaxID=314230 RepID=A3ZVI8_9BACT|nr:hypothetical protein DSM3645_02623 [Blastopirellula marina DSM 3645]
MLKKTSPKFRPQKTVARIELVLASHFVFVRC